MVELIVAQLPYTAAKHMWAEFADSIGKQALHNAYGEHWPREPIHDEYVFEFSVPTCGGLSTSVGWGSLLWDAAERVTWLSLGINPAQQNQGIRLSVSHWLRGWAFRNTECVAVGNKILDTNPRFQKWMRENGSMVGWKFAGHISFPIPGHDMYIFDKPGQS